MSKVLCSQLLVILILGMGAHASHTAVVVDKSNATFGLTAVDLARILKFENRKWPDGRNVVLILRDPSLPEMQATIEKLGKIQAVEFRALIAAHKSAVFIVSSDEELLKSVASIPGAVGLVDVYSITGGINVLRVDGKLPLEQGYLLRGK